jgi:WD40 repeat protein
MSLTNYIVASFGGDNTVHVLSSRTGEVLQKRPFKGHDMIGGLVLDGDNVILTCARDANLYVYNIPSE